MQSHKRVLHTKPWRTGEEEWIGIIRWKKPVFRAHQVFGFFFSGRLIPTNKPSSTWSVKVPRPLYIFRPYRLDQPPDCASGCCCCGLAKKRARGAVELHSKLKRRGERQQKTTPKQMILIQSYGAWNWDGMEGWGGWGSRPRAGTKHVWRKGQQQQQQKVYPGEREDGSSSPNSTNHHRHLTVPVIPKHFYLITMGERTKRPRGNGTVENIEDRRGCWRRTYTKAHLKKTCIGVNYLPFVWKKYRETERPNSIPRLNAEK